MPTVITARTCFRQAQQALRIDEMMTSDGGLCRPTARRGMRIAGHASDQQEPADLRAPPGEPVEPKPSAHNALV